MATWTTIADARLEPDKPARSIDALALRDNPIAIAENAANAPKVNQYYLLITASTTWTVPKTGQYLVQMIGGGGSGGGGAGGSGGGGGGSGYVLDIVLTLTQGDTYPIVLGAGGAGGANGSSTTGFGQTAGGGGGGGSSGAGGFGHTTGGEAASTSGGKGASSPTLIPGVNANNGANNGGPSGGAGGIGYGGGGGGGAYAVAGGAGAQGAVIIRGI